MNKIPFLLILIILLQSCGSSITIEDDSFYYNEEINLKYKLDTISYKFEDIDYIQNFVQNYKEPSASKNQDSCFTEKMKLHFIVKPKNRQIISKNGYMNVVTIDKLCEPLVYFNEEGFNKVFHSNHNNDTGFRISTEMTQLFANISEKENIIMFKVLDSENEIYSVVSSYEYPDCFLIINLFYEKEFENNALDILKGFEN